MYNFIHRKNKIIDQTNEKNAKNAYQLERSFCIYIEIDFLNVKW